MGMSIDIGVGCALCYFTVPVGLPVEGSRGPSPWKFLISKGSLMQSKAYWELYTQYVTKS